MARVLRVLVLLLLFVLSSCSDSDDSPTNLKSDIVGKWLVTRSLVSGSSDFPQGYKDIQEWTFTKSGDQVTLTTAAGSVLGTWQTSQTWAKEHWVFNAEWYDPNYQFTSKVVVEVIGINPFKGTNETYYRDPYTGMWLLLDAFSLAGKRI